VQRRDAESFGRAVAGNPSLLAGLPMPVVVVVEVVMACRCVEFGCVLGVLQGGPEVEGGGVSVRLQRRSIRGGGTV